MRATCAISGIRFNSSYLESVSISHKEGYFHPVFALPYRSLHHLYTKHTKGELTSNDSYLLFISFLHSSGQIEWKHPSTLNPNSSFCKKLIENNLAQLIVVLEKTAVIRHPSFSQPSFKVTLDNSRLDQIPNWIEAWQDNIDSFQKGRISQRERQSLQEVENKLSKLILSGENPEKFSHVIANWANQAAEFPEDRAEEWMKTIRSCFSINKMFNTPLALLKEIKDYCECNIEVGSIHFHTLSHVLKEGISRHVDYLGGSSLALGYTLLESPLDRSATESEKKNEAELLALASTAPERYPEKKDYTDSLSFLKAKLAFRVAKSIAKKAEEKVEVELDLEIPAVSIIDIEE
jgi:hypothetical protein